MAVGPKGYDCSAAHRGEYDALEAVVMILEKRIDEELLREDSCRRKKLKLEIREPLTTFACATIGKGRYMFDSLLGMALSGYLLEGWKEICLKRAKVFGRKNSPDHPGFIAIKIVLIK